MLSAGRADSRAERGLASCDEGFAGRVSFEFTSFRLSSLVPFGNAGWIFDEYRDAYKEHPDWKHEGNPTNDANA